MDTKVNRRGGARPGAGRPRKNERLVRHTFTLTRPQMAYVEAIAHWHFGDATRDAVRQALSIVIETCRYLTGDL